MRAAKIIGPHFFCRP